MKLSKIIIHKYKSFENDQEINLKDDVTILVGMNESGKTSVLEAVAKTNYFSSDPKFKFSKTHDYPRREKKKMDRSGVEPAAITCIYQISKVIKDIALKELGPNVFNNDSISRTTSYENKGSWNDLNISYSAFLDNQLNKQSIYSKTLADKLHGVKNEDELQVVINSYTDEKIIQGLKALQKFYVNSWKWDSPVQEFIARTILKPAFPKFLYYDEYYSLPSRIVIEKLETQDLEEDEFKTAKALLELADLKPEDIIKSTDFEEFIAELEATEATISDELFKYWTTNQNLNIEFKIQSKEEKTKRKIKNNYNQEEIIEINIVEHILDIRVKNQRTRVSLPLKNRSKGFNWFFSFLVWFKKIQEDTGSQYILLLDEPGLNLHASAQGDMLRFIEDLSKDYQIIYTTHSPFAIPSNNLDRVRTVLETKDGSIVSDSIQEKDPNTLFPLQAALGYDIAQNLFVSSKNLLVEGVSDLIILTSISGFLEEKGRSGLRSDVTLVPTGGLDKVATFISLLRGSKLQIACLLDSFSDAKGKANLEKMIFGKIIHKSKIRFFDEFIGTHEKADLEDMFTKNEYLSMFNAGFKGEYNLKIENLNIEINQVIIQINKAIDRDRYNHYRPAAALIKNNDILQDLGEETLKRFEDLFKEMNSLFS